MTRSLLTVKLLQLRMTRCFAAFWRLTVARRENVDCFYPKFSNDNASFHKQNILSFQNGIVFEVLGTSVEKGYQFFQK